MKRFFLQAIVVAVLSLTTAETGSDFVTLTPPIIKPMYLMDKIACYRPVRQVIPRIEVEPYNPDIEKIIAHNYGHGGSGWTEAPGSAIHVVRELQSEMMAAGMATDEPITIVGGGIIGLTTAFVLHREGFTNITVVAESFEKLTSHTAGGLWAPSYQTQNKTVEEQELYERILRDSLSFYRRIIGDTEDPFHKAVSVTPLYAKKGMPFQQEVKDYYAPPQNVRVRFGASHAVRKMIRYNDSIFIQVVTFMGVLQKYLKGISPPVTFVKRRVNKLEEVPTRVVINCAGLGARELTGDSTLHPVLGNMLHTNNEPNNSLNYMILYHTGLGEDAGAGSGKGAHLLFFPKLTGTGQMGILGGSFIPVADTTEQHGEQFTRIIRDAQWLFHDFQEAKISDALADGSPHQEADADAWRQKAIETLWELRFNMSTTPIYKVPVPGHPQLKLYFKDETKSLTGNLKNRFAWGLFHWALIEGHVTRGTKVYEGSSGSMAASEAFIASHLNISFTACVPRWTEPAKIKRIEENGGKVAKINDMTGFLFGGEDRGIKKYVRDHGGFYMNQFANAERAEEFHESEAAHLLSVQTKATMELLKAANVSYESTNLMHEIVGQLQEKESDGNYVYPDYFVHSAGTGGTISSVGRYVRKYGLPTQVVLADTEFSVYYDYVVHGDFKDRGTERVMPGVEGTAGFQPAKFGDTTSLQRHVIDRVIKVPDIATAATLWAMKEIDDSNYNGDLSCGPTTALAFITALSLAAKEKTRQVAENVTRPYTITMLRADPWNYYADSYFNISWIEYNFALHGGLAVFNCWKNVVHEAYRSGTDPIEVGGKRCSPKAYV